MLRALLWQRQIQDRAFGAIFEPYFHKKLLVRSHPTSRGSVQDMTLFVLKYSQSNMFCDWGGALAPLVKCFLYWKDWKNVMLSHAVKEKVFHDALNDLHAKDRVHPKWVSEKCKLKPCAITVKFTCSWNWGLIHFASPNLTPFWWAFLLSGALTLSVPIVFLHSKRSHSEIALTLHLKWEGEVQRPKGFDDAHFFCANYSSSTSLASVLNQYF